jgi:hypothetical protein
MAEEKQLSIERIFEQPADAISFHCDMTQVISTGHEIIIQAYEAIPGVPSGPESNITKVRTRLRATFTVNMSHAKNIGNLLIKKATQGSKK